MKTRLCLTVLLLLCLLPGHPVSCFQKEEEPEAVVEQVERGEEEVIAEEVAEKARDVDPPAQLQYPLEGNVEADEEGRKGAEVGGKEEEEVEKLKVSDNW